MSSNPFHSWVNDSLVWLPEREMGYFNVKAQPYDRAYFEKYLKYAGTEMGAALTRARVDLVKKYWNGPLVDVGIGCGQFIEARGSNTRGVDVNPHAIHWLQERGLYYSPYDGSIEAAAFWDSLEHIPEPEEILRNITRLVFVSLPIFRDAAHVLASKHYRRDEHCWYWTRPGLIRWMAEQGWGLIERNDMEKQLGREDIETYIFERKNSVEKMTAPL